mmetsp:Transcript_3916/g.6614  ORF Transcript_3916/g.6614 Transcript_3916/m.6614 type:complete len:127 (+) Transcript_3916:1196-1576(+)
MAASSVRFYYEFFGHDSPVSAGGERRVSAVERLSSLDVQVPTAFALFPVEIFVPVEFFAQQYYSNIVHWHHMPKGGHFAALEEPVLLARDLWSLRDSIRERDEGSRGSDRDSDRTRGQSADGGVEL